MKRSLIILILLFVIVAPVRAATDTVQGRIASFVAALQKNPYAYAKEPPSLVVCGGQIAAVLANYTSPASIYFPDSVKADGCDLYLFHPPFIGGRSAIAPPAPQDLSLAALHEVHSITAVGFDVRRKVGTLDTMTQTRLYWPSYPFLDVSLFRANWQDSETAKIRALPTTAQRDAFERSEYARIAQESGGWLSYSTGDVQ